MRRLAARFAARMHKWNTGSKGETTLMSEGNRPKLSSPDEEAQKE